VQRTHHGLDPDLCGRPRELSAGKATVELTTTPAMAADEHRLVHGGFVFGLADHAAMLAVNEPTVVIGSADVRFTAPVTVGQTCVAQAHVVEHEGRKHVVEVHVHVGATEVMHGQMTCFVPATHVLSRGDA
jgi:acyl-coenzyme A thioesterase PaaI-like protein